MVQLPSVLVDFADALKTLVASQSDVTQLVTKWDEIVNTDTPRTVKITLSDGTEHSVDNLAKIRNDLVEGLSLDRPTVAELNFQSRYGAGGSLTATRYVGYAPYRGINSSSSGPSEDPFDKYEGFSGFVRAARNDFFTVCAPNKATTTFNLLQMPRVMWLGVPDVNNNIIDTFNFTVESPNQAMISQGLMAAWQYGGIITLINAYTTREGTLLGDVTVNLVLNPGDSASGTLRLVIPQQSYVTLVLWAWPGQPQVNCTKIGEGSTV